TMRLSVDTTQGALMKFNETILNQVITEAKTKAAGCPRWLRAIDRAVEGLQSGRWYVTELVNETIITTENGTYHVNGHCQCKAGALGQPCKHRSAVRLLALYNEAVNQAASKTTVDNIQGCSDDRPSLIAEIKRVWPATWPPLYTELLARFGKS